MSELDIVNVEKEIRIHVDLNHPNIVKLVDFLQEKDTVYLIMEYVSGGNLFDFINRNNRISKKMIHRIFYNVLEGVQYLHKKAIILRDLKPENILINPENRIKSRIIKIIRYKMPF